MLRLNKYFLSCKGKVYNIFKAMFSCEKRNRVNENWAYILLDMSLFFLSIRPIFVGVYSREYQDIYKGKKSSPHR